MDKKLLFVYNAKSGKAKIRAKLADIIDTLLRLDIELKHIRHSVLRMRLTRLQMTERNLICWYAAAEMALLTR